MAGQGNHNTQITHMEMPIRENKTPTQFFQVSWCKIKTSNVQRPKYGASKPQLKFIS